MFEIEEIDSIQTLILSGEVDLDNSSKAREMMLSIVEKNQDINIDLSKVEYIDSSGVAVLVEAMQLTQRTGKKFSVVNVSSQVMAVLELAHLDKILPISNVMSSENDNEVEDNPFSGQDNPFASSGDAETEALDSSSDQETKEPETPSNNPFIG